MKKSQIASISFCLLIIMGFALSACSPTAKEPDVYKIGFSFPLTGDLASYGDSASKAAILAQEEINADGGINGIPIEVVIEDDRCDGEGGLTVLNKMSASGVPVVTGFFCSSGVLSVCDRYNELEIVQYVIGSNPGIFAEDGCGPYTFGFFGNDNDQGREQARMVLEDLGETEAGVIYVNNDYGIGVKDAFIDAFTEGGGEVVIELGVQQEGTEFRTEVARLKEAGPDVTIFVMYGSTGAIFLKQAAELGLETQFVGDNNWASIETLMMEPTGAEGILAPSTEVGTPEYDAFVELFNERWGEDPFFGSDLAYDQIYVAAYAIEEGGYTGEAIREATTIVAEDYVGASGPKAMPNGKNVIYNFSWVQFIDGEVVPFNP